LLGSGGVSVRLAIAFFTLATLALAQVSSNDPAKPTAAEPSKTQVTIAAGTKVPVALKHAISTKSAREGDAVYAETTFPVVDNGRILIPAGTYVQGKISEVKRAGRVKGRAEVLMHFTTLIYPSGYTVVLPGSVENVPGAEKTSMKGDEGTIRADSQKGEKIGTVASTAGTGAVVGGLSRGGKGALIGAGIGGAVGTAIAMLTRNNEVKLDAGTTLEMVIQREVPLELNRIQQAKN
jgi:type IV secretory pathway VirB10-like protein